MKNGKNFFAVCILSAMFLLVASQPLLAAERIVKLVVPGCEWPVTAHRVGDALKEIPGILQYDANQFNHEVTVTYDDTKTSINEIVDRLAKEDFPIEGKPKIVRWHWDIWQVN